MAAVAPPQAFTGSSTLLSQLETDIKALLGTGPVQTIDLSKLGSPVPGVTKSSIPGLTALLGKLTSKLAPITGAHLTPAAETLTLTGTLQWVNVETTFILTAVFSVSSSDTLQLVATCQQGSTSTLSLLALAKLLGHATPYTPDASLSGLALAFGTASSDFSFTGSMNWPVPFGNPNQQPPSLVVAAQLTFTTTSAAITGTLTVKGQVFQVTCDLAKDANTLEASWTATGTPLTWNTLVDAGGFPGASLPGKLTGPSFTKLDLLLNFSERSLTFTTQLYADEFLLIQKGDTGWGFALGIHQESASFELGSLSDDLACFDFFSLSNGCLVVSTFGDNPFAFPTISSTTATAPFTTLVEGLNFGATVSFPPPPSGNRTMNRLFGSMQAQLSGYLGKTSGGQPNASITATLEGITIPDTELQLVAPSLTATLAGEDVSVTVAGGVIVSLGQGQTPLTINGSIEIDDLSGLTITLDAEADFVIPAPVGLHGVVLQNAGGSLGIPDVPDPTIKLSFEVGFALGGDTTIADGDVFSFGLWINPGTLSAEPVYLYGKIGQTITLPLLLNTLAPQIEVELQKIGGEITEINKLLDQFRLSNLDFQYATEPNQVMPDGTLVPLGCSMSGAVKFLSFSMSGSLQLEYDGNNPKDSKGATGASGSFTMSPILIQAKIAGSEQTLVSVSGVPAPADLAFSFDTDAFQTQSSDGTTTPCLASASIAVSVLGASSSLVASIETTGLHFQFSASSRGVSITITCVLTSATGLSASVLVPNPLSVGVKNVALYAPNGTYLGTLNFSGSVKGSLCVTANTSGATIQLNLFLTLTGIAPVALTSDFSATPSDLGDLATTLEREIKANAASIFSGLTSDLSQLEELSKAGAFTATAALTSAWQDATTAVTYATTIAVQGAENSWNTLQNTLKNLGSTVLNELENVFDPGRASAAANNAIQAALANPALSTPALKVTQFSSLAPLGSSGGQDPMLLGLDAFGLPYLITWQHKLGGSWKAGRALPTPAAATLGFSSLALCVAPGGDTEVIGLGTDGTPYVVCFLPASSLTQVLDRRIGWQAGVPLPCPAGEGKFTALASVGTSHGELLIVGLDAGKHACLVSTLSNHSWQPGTALPCPANQGQFTTIGACTTRNGDVQVYGVGVDAIPYIIAWLPGGEGSGWRSGAAMACPTEQSHYTQLLFAGPSGSSFFIGLGIDGKPYVVTSMDAGGAWQSGRALPLPAQMGAYKQLAVGSIWSGDFQVFGIGTDSQAYIACYLAHGSGEWKAAGWLPGPPLQMHFASVSYGTNGFLDGEVCGLGTDGKPYLISYFPNNPSATWTPGMCMNIA